MILSLNNVLEAFSQGAEVLSNWLDDVSQNISDFASPEPQPSTSRPYQDRDCVDFATRKDRAHQMYGQTRRNHQRFHQDYRQCLEAKKTHPKYFENGDSATRKLDMAITPGQGAWIEKHGEIRQGNAQKKSLELYLQK